MVFVDTNVLVYATVSNLPAHEDAVAALLELEADQDGVCISRQVIRELLAVLTRHGGRSLNVPRAQALSAVEAWANRYVLLEEMQQ